MNPSNISYFNQLAANSSFATYVNGKLLLNFDKADDKTYSKWDAEGFSEFIFELNILTGTQYGLRPTSCELSTSEFKIEGIMTKIGKKIAKVNDIVLRMNTYDINTGQKNKKEVAFPLDN